MNPTLLELRNTTEDDVWGLLGSLTKNWCLGLLTSLDCVLRQVPDSCTRDILVPSNADVAEHVERADCERFPIILRIM